MKKNLPVTGVATDFPSNMTLISSTDLKGVITYVNEDFKKVSGFDDKELLGKSHNVVRHPDMPPAAFEDLWASLKAGKPWLGLVKNRCKNGDHYWVEAHVTPLFAGGEIVGYESVRVKPEKDHVERAERLYKAIWKGKTPFKPSWLDSIHHRLLLIFSLALVALGVAGLSHVSDALFIALLLLLGGLTLALTAWQLSPLGRLGELARSVSYDPITLRAFTGRLDETAQAEMAIRMLQANNRTILRRIQDNAHQVSENAHTVSHAESDTSASVAQQQARIDQTATAMREMSLAISEIARVTAEAAHAANEADRKTHEGREVVLRAVNAVAAMAEEVGHTEQTIELLAKDSQDIGSIINVIRYIAEQTNLLALNAAIEAARAGEQGRGFAVVADEVRSLALKTQEATTQIQTMINRLQERAHEAVRAMHHDEEQAQGVVALARAADQALEDIARAVSTIHEMNTQVAAAVEEQSAVSGDISENIAAVRDLASKTMQMSASVTDASDRLACLADQQRALVDGFSRIG
ncbi:MAG: methyl-accepting chemotaxis protein [Pseudomonadota bacterium]|jgi:PAS domain S-box-containing protein